MTKFNCLTAPDDDSLHGKECMAPLICPPPMIGCSVDVGAYGQPSGQIGTELETANIVAGRLNRRLQVQPVPQEGKHHSRLSAHGAIKARNISGIFFSHAHGAARHRAPRAFPNRSCPRQCHCPKRIAVRDQPHQTARLRRPTRDPHGRT